MFFSSKVATFVPLLAASDPRCGSLLVRVCDVRCWCCWSCWLDAFNMLLWRPHGCCSSEALCRFMVFERMWAAMKMGIFLDLAAGNRGQFNGICWELLNSDDRNFKLFSHVWLHIYGYGGQCERASMVHWSTADIKNNCTLLDLRFFANSRRTRHVRAKRQCFYCYRHKLKRPMRTPCWTRTSRSAAERSSSCRNGPDGGYATRPESNGTCCPCPCGCAPNAYGWRRPSWSDSTDPPECRASDQPTSWCAGSCCRWRNALGRHRGCHAGWYLFIIICRVAWPKQLVHVRHNLKIRRNVCVQQRSLSTPWLYVPIWDGVMPFFPNFLICSFTSSAFSFSHDGTVRRYGRADWDIPLLHAAKMRSRLEKRQHNTRTHTGTVATTHGRHWIECACTCAQIPGMIAVLFWHVSMRISQRFSAHLLTRIWTHVWGTGNMGFVTLNTRNFQFITQERAYDPCWIDRFHDEKEKAEVCLTFRWQRQRRRQRRMSWPAISPHSERATWSWRRVSMRWRCPSMFKKTEEIELFKYTRCYLNVWNNW